MSTDTDRGIAALRAENAMLRNQLDMATMRRNTAGWMYRAGIQRRLTWSRHHPIESNQHPDATEIERVTIAEFSRRR